MGRRALLAVPQTQPRAVMYGRVSAVMGRGDDLTSPELQEHVVREYCLRRGYAPVSWLCDVDLSGKSWSRRQVEQAVKMVEAGQIDVIVVPRWSRFTRNLRDYVIQTARIEAAGGRVESALEETDPATAAGLLQRDLFAILAQWESRKIGEQWKETFERRRRQGLPHNMAKRTGYRIADGRYCVDPVEGPIVTELFQRYLNGDGIVNLCRWLERVGVNSPTTGKAWTPRGLRLFMESGFAAGLLHVGDTHLPGIQPALITPETWEQYKRARRQRRGTPPRLAAPTTPLSALIYCGACNQRMRVKSSSPRQGSIPGYLYICEMNVQCSNRASITRQKLEVDVKSWLTTLTGEGAERTAAVVAGRASAALHTIDRQKLLKELARVDHAIVSNRAQHLLGNSTAGERDAVDGLLRDQKQTLEKRLEESGDTTPPQLPPVEQLRFVLEQWDSIPVQRLNQLLRAMIRRVVVTRLLGWRQREIEIIPAWDS